MIDQTFSFMFGDGDGSVVILHNVAFETFKRFRWIDYPSRKAMPAYKLVLTKIQDDDVENGHLYFIDHDPHSIIPRMRSMAAGKEYEYESAVIPKVKSKAVDVPTSKLIVLEDKHLPLLRMLTSG